MTTDIGERKAIARAQTIRRKFGVPQNEVITGPNPPGIITVGPDIYSGSSITPTSQDFQGDWRALDAWMRQDLYRVRNRSRQLQRGNPYCIALSRNLRNNILGHAGFHMKVNALTMSAYGDTTDGQQDKVANALIVEALRIFGKPSNFTTRKMLSRKDVDQLLVAKLCFDGEFIARKRRGFQGNDYGFAWQIIDPDYLDHNLNRMEDNGNITKMGVELDKTDKFPVAYHFLERRPNDYWYSEPSKNRYIRVPADEVTHLFIQTDDSEQTRGIPWIFAALVNLFRAEKFTEAAVVNAAIGASKPFFYTKMYPEGFSENKEEFDRTDEGYIVDKVSPGAGIELPYGVEAKTVDTRYPDDALEPFMQVIGLGLHLTFGTSYATTTGDLSQANFVSSKLGMGEEQEFYQFVQGYIIEHWKEPGYDEELYRLMLAGKIKLPISKFEKFNQPVFTGRRWSGLQPLEEANANQINLNNKLTSVSMILESQGKDPLEVFTSIQSDEQTWEDLGIGGRVATAGAVPTDPPDDGTGKNPGEKTDPKKEGKDKPKK